MISELISFQNNGVISVVEFLTSRFNTIEYISGPAAIKKHFIEVKEISQTGSVNNLVVHNISDKYIFFSDGDILSGAKQNRVLNTSIFLAPHSTKNIPVSCVESGRWNYKSETFSDTDYNAPVTLRFQKSFQVNVNLEKEKGYTSDQHDVWYTVARCMEMNKISSSTNNLSDIYDFKKSEYEEITKPIKASDKANGLAVFIHNKLLSVELFNRKDIYLEYFDKILKGVASESLYLKPKEDKLKQTEAFYKTNVFFDELANRKYKEYPGAAEGKEKRYTGNDYSGFSLEFNDHLIHLTMLSLVRKN